MVAITRCRLIRAPTCKRWSMCARKSARMGFSPRKCQPPSLIRTRRADHEDSLKAAFEFMSSAERPERLA